MNDSEFIEILNLYLDHEISAADTARLEAEVTSNPDRRQIYRQYCRMHKACILLGDQKPSRTPPAWESEARGAAAPRAWSTGFAAAGMLAAACIAIVVLVRTHQPASAVAAPAPLAQAPTQAAPQPAFASVTDRPEQLQPVFTARALPPLVASSGAAPMPSPELNAQFAWMNHVELAPIQGTQIEPAMFQPAPVLLDADNRAIVPQTQAERAAFQFQR